MIYKTLVPKDNAAFRSFGLQDFSENAIVNFSSNLADKPLSYYEGLLNAWWYEYDTVHAQAAEQEVQNIIDLYFPDGRP